MEDNKDEQKKVDKLTDPVFQGIPIESNPQTGIAPEVSSIPRSIFKIGEEKIFVIKKYLQLIWDIYCKNNDGGRLINVTEILDNCFSLFSVTELRGQDVFWKEHASANLRELSYKLSRENYREALTCIDIDNLEVSSYFDDVDRKIDCLHNCAHFRTVACINNTKTLLNITDPNISDDEVFDQLVASYLNSIYVILSKCKK
jgi:hypothetical protein